jgi:CubicO group peptidase (beta-lactamase class C family)
MNFSRWRYVVALILTGLGTAVAPAAPTFPPEAVAGAAARAGAVIQTNVAPKVPGLAVAVAMNGAIIWSQAFGYADLDKHLPVTPATRFRIGSVSKPLTAAGLALLIEQGRMKLDDPVQKYIPDYPQPGAVITLRLLAGHLSGIRNYRGYEAVSNRPYPTLRSGLKIFENDPLISVPGAKFNYSSYNWNVIGAAMEVASGRDFLDYMQSNVFLPLGLTNTGPDVADATDPRRTQFYESDAAGKFIVAPAVDSSYKWPSGGFLSTAEDLTRFGSALLQPGFLRADSLRMLFTSQTTTDGQPTHYGVGWFVGRTLLYHNGDSVGGTSVLLLQPASHTVVAIVCNRGHFVFGGTPGSPVITQKADLNLTATAQMLAQDFAPLAANP